MSSDEECDNSERVGRYPSRLKGALSFRSKEVGGYRLGRTLGKGSCAVVKLGTHKDTGKQVAVKILKPRTLREQKEALREVEALQRLNHPNITTLHQVIREKGYTCMILEFCEGGELFDYIMNSGKLDEGEARSMFRQILSGVQYSHANLVAHRDLKPENLLLDRYGNIKISDFGLSNVIKPGKLFSTWCGSPVYTPPEVVMRQQYNGIAMDVWSLGVVLYVLVTGGMPWRLESNVVKNMDDLIIANYEIPDFLGVSKECKELIGMMLVADGSQRASLETIMNHRWTCESYGCPPQTYLQPKPLVSNINEMVFAQLENLGHDLVKAREEIKTNSESPALVAYHLLLQKHHRIQKVNSCQVADASAVNTPAQFLNTITRTRSRSYPTPVHVPIPRSPLKKELSDGALALADGADISPASSGSPKREKGIIRSFIDRFRRSPKKSASNNKSPASSSPALSHTMPITIVASHNSPSPLVRRRLRE